MKKLVLKSVVAGVVCAALTLISILIFRVVDSQFASFVFGAMFVVFWVLCWKLVGPLDHKVESVEKAALSLAIMGSTDVVILMPLKLVWAPSLTPDFDLSYIWASLGLFLFSIVDYIIRRLYRLRKNHLAEKLRQTRLVELMNK